MSQVWPLLKREFEAYFATPLAAIFVIVFLLSMGAFTFYVGNFYENGVADLKLFFGYQPWLYLFLIPALAMRLWAEEKRSGSIELLLTLPISPSAAVIAKFLAAWAFVGLALALTFPIWLTVNYLGHPDNGVILVAYLGSFLMAGAYLSISAAISATTKSQVIAFVASVAVSFLFTMPGAPQVLNLLEDWLPLPVVQAIASFSFLTHFNTIVSGVLDLRDVVFFGSVIALFLSANILIVRMQVTARPVYVWPALGLCAVMFLAVNIAAGSWFTHAFLDFTQDREYTLSDGTKSVIAKLPDPVTLKFFYSRKVGAKYPLIASYAGRVRDLLSQYAALSHGKIVLEDIDPEPFTAEEDEANAAGLSPIPTAPGERMYFGLEGNNSLGQTEAIAAFSADRSPTLEYDLTAMLDQLARPQRPKLALLSSLPLAHGGKDGAPLAIYDQLQHLYNVVPLSSDFLAIPPGIGTIFIAHPQGLGALQLKAIEHYVLSGGHLILFVDPASEIVRRAGDPNGVPSSNLVPLLSGWGVSYSVTKVVLDRGAAQAINASGDPRQPSAPYPLWLHLIAGDFNRQDPITANLQNVNMASVGVLSPIKGATTHFEPLIFSTNEASLADTNRVMKIYDPAQMMAEVTPSGNRYVLAARISGKAIFPGVESGMMNIIVVADTDILDDRFWVGDGQEPFADNGSFILNAIENLSGSDALASLRSRGTIERPFTRVKAIEAKAQQDFQQKLQDLQARLATERQDALKLEQIGAGQGVESAKVKTQIAQTRSQLRDVAHNLRAGINGLGNWLAFLNIWAMPILVAAFTGMLGLLRRRRAARSAQTKALKPVILATAQPDEGTTPAADQDAKSRRGALASTSGPGH